MTRPTSGTAIDVEGTISATISWNTLRDRSIVIPADNIHTAFTTAAVNSNKKQESCAVAKITARCASDRTIRQYAHGLLPESPFVPSSTDCWAVRAKIRQKLSSPWP